MAIMWVCLHACMHCNSLKTALDNCAGDTKSVERKHSMLSYNDRSANAKVSRREKKKRNTGYSHVYTVYMHVFVCVCVCVCVNTDPL